MQRKRERERERGFSQRRRHVTAPSFDSCGTCRASFRGAMGVIKPLSSISSADVKLETRIADFLLCW